MFEITVQGKDTVITLPGFSLADTLDCGQCFRFEQQPDGKFFGVAAGKALLAEQKGDRVIFYNTSKQDFNEFWCNYFDFNTDYEEIKSFIAADPVINKALPLAGGIRILRQDSWEALCSFIISQNNNIPRIKGIISRLCESFGNVITQPYRKEPVFSFPTPDALANCTYEDLAVLRAGFRAKYILDAAQKVASGDILLADIRNMNLEDARKALMNICGVGPKVAECALLFGFGKAEAFPVDVWIKRALGRFYKDGFPDFLQPYGGIAQQILFHYIRNTDITE